MNTVKLSTFDRLVNIHQSVELHLTKRINQRILQEQILQNAEMRYLNNQLSASNQINRQILENQISEIKHKEEQKFYKALSFQMHELIEPINNITDQLVKKYFIDRYYEKIKTNLLSANDNLEEINDKSFSKNTLKKANEIKDASDIYLQQFNESPFKELDTLIQEIKARRQELSNFKPPEYFEIEIKNKPKFIALRIVGLIVTGTAILFILLGLLGNVVSNGSAALPIIPLSIVSLFFIAPFIILLTNDLKWRKGYLEYSITQNQKRQTETNKKIAFDRKYQEELTARENTLMSDPRYITYEGIIKSYPEFERVIAELSELEISFAPKNDKVDADILDPLFKEAARLVVMHQQGSISLIQRKLKLGYNRANRILEQLEVSGIIKRMGGNFGYKVLIANEHELEIHLKSKRQR